MSVRHALLALLSEGPKYGLQLRQEFEARTGEVWPLNVGQVYTTLQRLERDGLVEAEDSDEEGPQKGFHITKDGASELEQCTEVLVVSWGVDLPLRDLAAREFARATLIPAAYPTVVLER